MLNAKLQGKANDESGDEPLVTAGPSCSRQAHGQARQRLDQLLLEGLNSPPITIGKRYWAAKKANLKKRLASR